MNVTVGTTAPDFELDSHQGGKVRLSGFQGKKHVVIAFHPLAWTPVWDQQVSSYQAEWSRFEALDAHVLGISVDSVFCKTAWAKSLGGLSFDLLADFHPKGEVARRYGVMRDGGISERAIFIVDKDGTIAFAKVYDIPTTPDDAEVFDALQTLSRWMCLADDRAVEASPDAIRILEYQVLVSARPDAVRILTEPCEGGVQIPDHDACPPESTEAR